MHLDGRLSIHLLGNRVRKDERGRLALLDEFSPAVLELLWRDVGKYRTSRTQRTGHSSDAPREEIRTSKNTKSRTVFGPRRMKAGSHPLNRNRAPSSRNDFCRTCTRLWSVDCEGSQRQAVFREVGERTAIIRERRTSAGEHTARGA